MLRAKKSRMDALEAAWSPLHCAVYMERIAATGRFTAAKVSSSVRMVASMM
jgi:hypothetical protein